MARSARELFEEAMRLAPEERASTSTTLQRPNLRPRREIDFAPKLLHQAACALPAPITSSKARRNSRWRRRGPRTAAPAHFTAEGAEGWALVRLLRRREDRRVARSVSARLVLPAVLG